MTVYCVYAPPLGSPSPAEETFRLVPDKKSPLALIVPIFWLIYHRLWVETLAYLALTLAIVFLFYLTPHIAIPYLSALPGFYLLLEGQELVRAKLERNGWRFVGTVEAENRQEAEFKYLTLDHETVSSAPVPPRTEHRMAAKVAHANPGLFPE